MTDLAAHGQLVLKLYELRRDPELRRARAWFASDFAPEGPEAVLALLAGGHDASAAYRMVTTYWEMAAALVNHGALDRGLFLAANTEHVVVFSKLQPHLAGLRELIREPGYLRELEVLVAAIPGVEALLASRRRFLQRWRGTAAMAR
ncbi:MAG: hypothetical protein U0P81_02565 [Holophagaceae bacterium]